MLKPQSKNILGLEYLIVKITSIVFLVVVMVLNVAFLPPVVLVGILVLEKHPYISHLCQKIFEKLRFV